MFKVIVLLSGYGSNLQALLDAKQRGLEIDISLVISNRPGCYGLEVARNNGLATAVIDHSCYIKRRDFEKDIEKQLAQHPYNFIVLAGFMRKLSAAFVNKHSHHMINIHPSLLPAFPGLRTYQAAITAQVAYHGTTIHYVTEQVDAGPILCQARTKVTTTDTCDSLKKRVQQLEYYLYPLCLHRLIQAWHHGSDLKEMTYNKPETYELAALQTAYQHTFNKQPSHSTP